MKKIFIFAYFLYLNTLCYCQSESLKVMQVILNEGARYPDEMEKQSVGPDSYDSLLTNFEYLGQLTKNGQLQDYNLGKMLRQTFDQWLGDYKVPEVYARTTTYLRAQMSLTAFLAGLYPLTQNTSFSKEVNNWSPVVIKSKPRTCDFLLLTKNTECEIHKLGLGNLTEVKEGMKPYQGFYEQLRNTTKIGAFEPIYFTGFYDYAHSFVAQGLPLPNWCNQECYQNLTELAKINYKSVGMSLDVIKKFGGPIIDEILKNIQNYQSSKNKIKVYIYAGHSVNIASFLQVHNVTEIPPIPEYGSMIVIQTLTKEDNKTYIRMRYWAGVSQKSYPFTLPNCEQDCLLEKYIEITKPMIPNEQEKMCYTSQRSCKEDEEILPGV